MTIDIRDAFFDLIAKTATEDPNFLVISCDMEAFALKKFQETFPDRYINAGVAEQNAINIAAGLASTGKKVLIFGILSFISTRCYEQIKLNICGMNLPVILVGIGPGISFSFDGPTHHSLNDMTLMRQMHNLIILNPSDTKSANASALIAMNSKRPVYVRIDKGAFKNELDSNVKNLDGLYEYFPSGSTNIIYTGTVQKYVEQIYQNEKKRNKELGLFELFQIQPIPIELIKILSESQELIIVEENTASGGIFNLISEIVAINSFDIKLQFYGIRSDFEIKYGERNWLFKEYRMNSVLRFVDE